MLRPERASVSPTSRAMTGARWRGRKRVAIAARWPRVFARAMPAKSPFASSPNRSGSWLIDSAPPASTSLASPVETRRAAVAIASIPEAQFRFTVRAGTRAGIPALNAITRAMLVASAGLPTFPITTWSITSAPTADRSRHSRATIRPSSCAGSPLSTLPALQNGVRIPLAMTTSRITAAVPPRPPRAKPPIRAEPPPTPRARPASPKVPPAPRSARRPPAG